MEVICVQRMQIHLCRFCVCVCVLKAESKLLKLSVLKLSEVPSIGSHRDNSSYLLHVNMVLRLCSVFF